MLIEILKALEQGRAYSQKDFAKLFDVSDETIKAQIEFLEMKGYIKRVTMPSCGGTTCAGCKGCVGGIKPPIMWEITNLREEEDES